MPGDGVVCGRCAPGTLRAFPIPVEGLRGVYAASRYGGGTGQALRHAKSHPDRHVAVRLAAGFGPLAAASLPARGVVVPVPSPPQRRLRRGFSTPALLARAVARAAGLPCRPVLTAWGGVRQAGLGAQARRANLAGRIRARTRLSGDILLVDDVITTGSTAEACARELLGSGATAVWLLALCASPRDTHSPTGVQNP